MEACTPAWVTIIGPASSSTARDMATAMTRAICQVPVPATRTKTSPTATPRATPATTSPTRRSRAAYETPRATMATTGAKNGRS